jgi:hypothetical protein
MAGMNRQAGKVLILDAVNLALLTKTYLAPPLTQASVHSRAVIFMPLCSVVLCLMPHLLSLMLPAHVCSAAIETLARTSVSTLQNNALRSTLRNIVFPSLVEFMNVQARRPGK